MVVANLTAGKDYHFQAVSYDASGNYSESDDQTFETPKEESSLDTSAKVDKLEQEITDNVGVEEFIKKASQTFIAKILEALPENLFLKDISEDLFNDSVSEMASKIVSAPSIAGDPQVETGSDYARITWNTDKKSNSMVAYSEEGDYDSARDDPYAVVVGDSNEQTTEHSVKIAGLEPSEIYHFQVRSKSQIGPVSSSPDKTFKTLDIFLEISNITFKQSDNKIDYYVSWKTNIASASKIKYTNIGTGEEQEVDDSSFLKDHVLTLKELKAGADYSFKIESEDESGNTAASPVLSFSTGEDSVPPEISQVRTSTTISPKEDQAQVIITWSTNEFSTSRIYYVLGTVWSDGSAVASPLDKTLTGQHTAVVSPLEPGMVYRFRVESSDSSGNTSVSQDFTFLTPQEKKTITQIIIQNFEQTFGWAKKLGV